MINPLHSPVAMQGAFGSKSAETEGMPLYKHAYMNTRLTARIVPKSHML